MSTTALAASHDAAIGCQICLSKDQQILAKDEVIRAKDAVIAAKDYALAQKDQALKVERELREQLQKQLKIASAAVSKKASIANMRSASSLAQEEKDALTIYIRNVTESMTYQMLYNAFSAFGTIRLLNVVHPKACAFVEFASADAYQKALAAASVPVGDGYDNVLTEKRVRKQQQPSFARRASASNLKAMSASTAQVNHTSRMVSTVAGVAITASTPFSNGITSSDNITSTNNKTSMKGAEVVAREDEGCDLTATC
ncbi:hypothetical protein BGZ80_003669 [Entomortierella chlamydospora]|uniref:RRM domain-containing protein n=1 Tax=Entomortierella chlamydospora TaxID=101097 RepID=A0A9P6T2S2_9FUNG|nr:hypothetical protein BGZ79_009201 [Entomortierella chlamydospora]KAG0020736.1 hypothetical protein BGZ80_003669 [Entomortierella chlamydospora]